MEDELQQPELSPEKLSRLLSKRSQSVKAIDSLGENLDEYDYIYQVIDELPTFIYENED